MSDKLTKWLNDNYPIPAEEMANSSDRQCIMHALKKWKGALRVKEYGLTYTDHTVIGGVHEFNFDGRSCSLCRKYPDKCQSHESEIPCPIVRYQGVPCDEGSDVYAESYDDPHPMINLLKETLNFIKQERTVIAGRRK